MKNHRKSGAVRKAAAAAAAVAASCLLAEAMTGSGARVNESVRPIGEKPVSAGVTTIYAADLFCGAGGATTALVNAARALGVDLDLVAVNHWTTAIETHSLNYPAFVHYCSKVGNVSPREAVPGGFLHVLMAGIECTHFSTARGGKPCDDQSRSSAWDVIRWLTTLDVQVLLLENVKEWEKWGPLHPEDHPDPKMRNRPDKSRAGEYFRLFLDTLRSLGYDIQHKVVCAADYGDPTTRRRFFLVATKRTPGRGGFVWPTATHCPAAMVDRFPDRKPWVAAREVIDWDIEGTSIYDRKKPLAENTLKRIYTGVVKYSGLPFLVPASSRADAPEAVGGGDGNPEQEPWVLPSFRDWKLLRGGLEGTEADYRDFLKTWVSDNGFTPPGGTLPAWKEWRKRTKDVGGTREEYDRLVDKAIAGAAFITPNFGERDGQSPRTHDVNQPMPAVTGRGAGNLIQPTLVSLRGTEDGQIERSAQSVDEPAPAVTAGGTHLGVAEPFVVANRMNNVPRDTNQPLATQCTGNNLYLLQPDVFRPFVGQLEHSTTEHGHRVYDTGRPLPTVTNRCSLALIDPNTIEPLIVGSGGPTGSGNATPTSDPMRTILSQNHMGLARTFLVVMKGKSDVSDVTEPSPTVTGVTHLGVAKPFVYTGYNHGDGKPNAGQPIDVPLTTVTAAMNHHGIVEPEPKPIDPILLPHQHGSDGTDNVRPITEPMPSVTATSSDMFVAEPLIVGISQTGSNGKCVRSAADPMPTITAKEEQALAQAFILRYNNGRDAEKRVESLNDPLSTVDASNRHALCQFVVNYNGTGTAITLKEPLSTVTAADRFGLVELEIVEDGSMDMGRLVGWLDIKFRMLQPHELAGAQGFPSAYQFAGGRDDKVRQIGNAWPIGTGTALCTNILKWLLDPAPDEATRLQIERTERRRRSARGRRQTRVGVAAAVRRAEAFLNNREKPVWPSLFEEAVGMPLEEADPSWYFGVAVEGNQEVRK